MAAEDYGFHGMLAKIAATAGDEEAEAKWLLYVDPDGDGAYLGVQIAAAIVRRTTELASARAQSAYRYDSCDAREKGEAVREDLVEQLDAVQDDHAAGKPVTGTPNPAESPGRGPTPSPAASTAPGGDNGTSSADRWSWRCWECGAGGICADRSRLLPERHVEGCGSGTVFETWPAGQPSGGRQKAAEELPAIMGRKPYKARTGSKGCEFCGMQIKKGDQARRCGKESSKGSSRRVCEACAKKHSQTNVEAAMALLSDDSTDNDWEH